MKRIITIPLFVFAIFSLYAQPVDGIKYPQLKFGATTQVWIRYTELNPGSQIYNEPANELFDISIRRLRLSVGGMVTNKTHLYIALGENNINYLNDKKLGINILDAVVTQEFSPAFHLGVGKTGWTGLSRYSSPSTSANMGMDIPLFALPTINISDDYLRKLSVFAKGHISKLSYRVILSKPYALESRGISSGISNTSSFASTEYALQSSGYFKYQLLDKESIKLPYHKGTYLGEKKILNLGVGYQYQPKAMWNLNDASDTIYHSMNLKAVDLFVDIPFYSSALTYYIGFFDYQLGPNYIRNIGMNNPANSTNNEGLFNGAGNKFPTIGTGQTVYSEIGWLISDRVFPQHMGDVQLYGTFQHSAYEALQNAMKSYSAGINYFDPSGNLKISYGLITWPVYQQRADKIEFVKHRLSGILKIQVKI